MDRVLRPLEWVGTEDSRRLGPAIRLTRTLCRAGWFAARDRRIARLGLVMPGAMHGGRDERHAAC
jgi:hypothetical protein